MRISENIPEGKNRMHIGFDSRISKNYHCITCDIDTIANLTHILEQVPKVIQKYKLPSFLVVLSSPFHYHLICFCKVKFEKFIEILEYMVELGICTSEYVYNTRKKGYGVLRVDDKNGLTPRPLFTVPSPYKEYTPKKTEYFTLLKWCRK